MSTFCGLDFGTSNSTVGVYQNDVCQLVPLENEKPVLRSAIFCDFELQRWEFGQAGINHYLDGVPGRLMMSLKSVLGSSLMNEKTVIFNEYVPYTRVLFEFIRHIKNKANHFISDEIEQVVMGRPVYFHDDDPIKDQLAQDTVASIARELGFKEVVFQYEPIAAALAYETRIQREQLALIIDMGGGTSDFTIIRLSPDQRRVDRSQDLLANSGIHIAGTDFDKKLSLHSVMPLLGMGSLIKGSSSLIEFPSWYYHDLTSWHLLAGLYDKKTIHHIETLRLVALEKERIELLVDVLQKKSGHHVLHSVEAAKQKLSQYAETNIDLSFLKKHEPVVVSSTLFNSVIESELKKIIDAIKKTVLDAAVNFSDIDVIFYTGGSTKIPIVREKINALFQGAMVVEGDPFGSVGLGLAIDAKRRFL